jgi:hypothetical protein
MPPAAPAAPAAATAAAPPAAANANTNVNTNANANAPAATNPATAADANLDAAATASTAASIAAALDRADCTQLEVSSLLAKRFGSSLGHPDLLAVFTSNYALHPMACAALETSATFRGLRTVRVDSMRWLQYGYGQSVGRERSLTTLWLHLL